MAHKILRRKETLSKSGLSNSTMYELIASGGFPKQIQIGPRAVGWLESDIDDWIDQRIAEAQAAA